MAGKWLLEDGSGGWQLQSGSGVWLLDYPTVGWDATAANTSSDYTIAGLTITRNGNSVAVEAIATLGKPLATGEGYFELALTNPSGITDVGFGTVNNAANYLHANGFGYVTDGRINFQGTDVGTGAQLQPPGPTAWNPAGITNANWSVAGLSATSSGTGGLLCANGFKSDGYLEFTIVALGSGTDVELGFTYSDNGSTNRPSADGMGYRSTGSVSFMGNVAGTWPALSAGDVLGVYLDESNAHVYFAKNGTWLNGANPSARTGGIPAANFFPGFPFYPAAYTNGAGAQVSVNFAGPFTYPLPTNARPFYSADIAGVYLRSGKAWVSRNGIWQGTGGDPSAAGPGYDLTGMATPVYPAVSTLGPGTQFIGNFGASNFAYPIPTSGNSWDGSQSAGAGTALTANSIATGSPALGTPTPGQVHALTPSALATGAPSLGSPAIGQKHALATGGTVTASPVIGTPGLVLVTAIFATGTTTGSPALGTPAIGQAHALTATGTATAAPNMGAAALGQVHSLTATALATSAPAIGVPVFNVTRLLTANPLATAAPQLGTPSVGQVHALSANGTATGAPALGTPPLGEQGQLIANPLVPGVPVLGSPVLGQRHALTPASMASAAPAVGVPAVGQAHVLLAAALGVASPAVGVPAFAQSHVLAGDRVATSSPDLGIAVLLSVHGLLADDLATGQPDLGEPSIAVFSFLPGPAAARRIVHGDAAERTVAGSPRPDRLVTADARNRTVTRA